MDKINGYDTSPHMPDLSSVWTDGAAWRAERVERTERSSTNYATRAGEPTTKSSALSLYDLPLQSFENGSFNVPADQYNRSPRPIEPLYQSLISQLGKPPDSSISLGELKKAVRRPDIRGDEAMLLTALIVQYDNARYLNDAWGRDLEITIEDVRDFDRLRLSEPNNALVAAFEKQLSVQARHMMRAAASDSLYGTRDYRTSIRPEAVMQGFTGDCYFMSAMASEAMNHPERLAGMISVNKNAQQMVVSYTVRFPFMDPVTVLPPTQSELALFAKGGSNGVWPAVLEKAYAEYRIGRDRLPRPTLSQDVLTGSARAEGLEILTGAKPDIFALNGRAADSVKVGEARALASEYELRRTIATALSRRLSMTAVSIAEWADLSRSGLPLREHHEYSILGFNERTGMVTLRDPAGKLTNGEQSAGIIEVHTNSLWHYFQSVNVAKA